MGKRKKKTRRKSFIGQFFKIVFSMVLIFVVFAGASIFAYTRIARNNNANAEEQESVGGSEISLLRFSYRKKYYIKRCRNGC